MQIGKASKFYIVVPKDNQMMHLRQISVTEE